ncbi:MAG: tRNA (adenosine(37)-N6)-threonylcarbamoyltransferase complex transferase subunit TsaD [Candidatus Zambryskibacteria bacterium]|nr:tRNA (adenosine(37)-N6)-threonylcarbamoyltransferase complex transferase subunit TsaD [Candidatus Zambryskibacteria bacterium]
MIILSIETSCDETAVSVVEAIGGLENPVFSVLGNALFSQIDIHEEFGGVVPMVAKREHAKRLPLLLKKVLADAHIYVMADMWYSEKMWAELKKILEREEGLYDELKSILENMKKPNIDVISVTAGPGLAPALWVGVSFAEALGKLWNIPVVPANHMEGHIASILLDGSGVKSEKAPTLQPRRADGEPTRSSASGSRPKASALKVKSNNTIQFPALALLISGGHTELVKIKNWGEYKILGETRDDAVGEAFDKVARMLGLSYPGGPQISALAEISRKRAKKLLRSSASGPRESARKFVIKFPRPMIHSGDYDFSFAGLKTSVLYYLRDNHGTNKEDVALNPSVDGSGDHRQNFICDVAREFEDAVVEVLVEKTAKAMKDSGAKTLIIAGGVIANKKLREEFIKFEKKYNDLIVRIPSMTMAGDNALMIAYATYINVTLHPELMRNPKKIIANGNLKL